MTPSTFEVTTRVTSWSRQTAGSPGASASAVSCRSIVMADWSQADGRLSVTHPAMTSGRASNAASLLTATERFVIGPSVHEAPSGDEGWRGPCNAGTTRAQFENNLEEP